MRILSAVLCLPASSLAHAAGLELNERLVSPDGHIVLQLQQHSAADGRRALYYNVRYDG
jgi:alpha-glucosidase